MSIIRKLSLIAAATALSAVGISDAWAQRGGGGARATSASASRGGTGVRSTGASARSARSAPQRSGINASRNAIHNQIARSQGMGGQRVSTRFRYASSHPYHPQMNYNTWFIIHGGGGSSGENSPPGFEGGGGLSGGGGASGSWTVPPEYLTADLRNGNLREVFFRCNPEQNETWNNYSNRCETTNRNQAVSKVFINTGCAEPATESTRMHLYRCAAAVNQQIP